LENKALHILATREFTNEKGDKIHAGDEYLFVGPQTYYPRS